MTKPIVYRHFASKKALYLALLEKHEADLPTFFEDVDDQLGPEPLARAILEHWLDYVRENQHAWLMLFRDSSGDDEIQAVRRRVSLRAREVVAGFVCAANGEPHSRRPDPADRRAARERPRRACPVVDRQSRGGQAGGGCGGRADE